MFAQTEILNEMDKLRKFALRLTGSTHDAEDLLQSTILRAFEKAHLFEEGTSLFKWTSKIMFNLFASQYRRRTRFETQYDPEGYIASQSVDCDQEIQADLRRASEAMKRLSPEHKEVLILVCIQGMRYQDVATALKLPVGTIRSRLSRARAHLQLLMDTPDWIDSAPASTPPGVMLERNNYSRAAA